MQGNGEHHANDERLPATARATGLELGKAVEIGDDVWVGGGSIICPGVRIGGRSVIGAGSVPPVSGNSVSLKPQAMRLA